MRYTWQYILDNRYDKNRSAVRKMNERYVVMSAITKALAPAPTYVLLNFGVHPDTATLMSFIFIILAVVLFFFGQPILAISSMLLFAFLDSVDGDMARCLGPTKYGAVFDSFGADLFYALMPVGVGYYLFSIGVVILGLSPTKILLVSVFVSLSFILYRLINTKVLHFRNSLKEDNQNHSQVAKKVLDSAGLVRLLELYRHVLVRGNFFSEPGMIFWFSVLILVRRYDVLAGYLIVLLLYNLGYLATNFVGTYVFFKSFKPSTK